MADLFQKDVRTINEHVQNIFDERELAPEAVIRKFRITASDGKTYETMPALQIHLRPIQPLNLGAPQPRESADA